MPGKPLKPCSYPGCRELTNTGRCERHKPKPWSNNNESKRVFKGRKLQKIREILFNEQPLCVECLKVDRVTPATIRDHIVPLAEGGQDIPENTQPLCQACSDAKTKEESKRGRRNAR
jgi:5-methylcytosine-specific restriction protein A